MDNTNYTGLEIVGFDLGHGESSLAKVDLSSKSDPRVISIQGSGSVITAIAMYPDGEVLIGDYAYMARHLNNLRICFKSPELKLEKVREPVRQFVNRIVELITQSNDIGSIDNALFVIGCPSGWNAEVRGWYLQLLGETSMRRVKLVSESRAAFLFIRDGDCLQVADDILKGAVLIIDIGSSTTDFTAVVNSSETYIDFGEIKLGAGLLDNAIFNYVLDCHERKSELQKIFEEHPQHQARCELACRKMKERYFSKTPGNVKTVSDTVKLNANPPVYFTIELDSSIMDKILAKPIAALGGQSWYESYKKALIHAREVMKYNLPQLIILTGGASRMGFAVDLCNDIFPRANVVRDDKPEFTIAKGLAIAGRIDIRVEQFRKEIIRLLDSERFRGIIESEMNQIICSIADLFIKELIMKSAFSAAEEWKKGQIDTLNNMKRAIVDHARRGISGQEIKQKLYLPIAAWFERFRPKINELIDPICQKYHIPRTCLYLPTCELNLDGYDLKDSINFDDLVSLGDFGVLINVTVSSVVAAFCGGGGEFALIATGPAGLIIGFIIGMVCLYYGGQKIKETLADIDIPQLARYTVTESKLKEMVEKQEGEIKKALLKSLEKGSLNYEALVNNIIEAVRGQLLLQAQKAELQVR